MYLYRIAIFITEKKTSQYCRRI